MLRSMDAIAHIGGLVIMAFAFGAAVVAGVLFLSDKICTKALTTWKIYREFCRFIMWREGKRPEPLPEPAADVIECAQLLVESPGKEGTTLDPVWEARYRALEEALRRFPGVRF